MNNNVFQKGDIVRIINCDLGVDSSKYLGKVAVITYADWPAGYKLNISGDNIIWNNENFKKIITPNIPYNTREYLNPIGSPSTGSVVCFDGNTNYDDGPYKNMFLELSDCHVKARIHKTYEDSVNDFIEKVGKLKDNIDAFYNHLIKTYNDK